MNKEMILERRLQFLFKLSIGVGAIAGSLVGIHQLQFTSGGLLAQALTIFTPVISGIVLGAMGMTAIGAAVVVKAEDLL